MSVMTAGVQMMNASTERSVSNYKVGGVQLYSVVLGYEGNTPNFSATVYATDEDNAVVVCNHEATNKGWPRDHATSHAIKLK